MHPTGAARTTVCPLVRYRRRDAATAAARPIDDADPIALARTEIDLPAVAKPVQFGVPGVWTAADAEETVTARLKAPHLAKRLAGVQIGAAADNDRYRARLRRGRPGCHRRQQKRRDRYNRTAEAVQKTRRIIIHSAIPARLNAMR